MSNAYKITPGKVYFVTITVVDWVDVFTRRNHRLSIVESLKYCQKEKGLEIYAWCLMPSHLHMIVSGEGDKSLSDILRDFKKYTSKKITKAIQEEPESRREWLLDRFWFAGCYDKKIKNFKFWKEDSHAIELHSPAFTRQKLEYIHNNPVEEMFVERPEDYLFSSARNYADKDFLLEVILLNTGISNAY